MVNLFFEDGREGVALVVGMVVTLWEKQCVVSTTGEHLDRHGSAGTLFACCSKYVHVYLSTIE